MSKKMSSATKFAITLTIIGCVIPTFYLNIFSEGYLLYHGLNYSGTITAGGLLCLIGAIGGIAGIFEKKAAKINRIICLVCTCLCVVFSLYAVSQFDSSTERAKRINCHSTLKHIHLALQQYAADYAGYYPPANGAAGLEMLRNNYYLSSHETYVCPSSSTDYSCNDIHPLTEENIDYVYIGGLNTKSDPNLPLAYDKAMNHGGYFGNVLFVDGTIKALEGDPWTQNIRK